MANDTDSDAGDTLSIFSVGAPSANGTVVNNGSDLSYTPAPGYVGVETFTYMIQDAAGLFSTATVTITVQKDTDKDGIGDSCEFEEDCQVWYDGLLDMVLLTTPFY